MTRPELEIKICGITAADDAVAAVEAGADAIGMIFVPRSPRYVDPPQATVIRQAVPDVCCVGVFMDKPVEAIANIAGQVGLDLVQLHGGETVDECHRLATLLGKGRLIKAVRFKRTVDYSVLAEYSAADIPVLVDGPFGLGPLDWNSLANWPDQLQVPLVLAGGLDPDNVAVAVATVRPSAVDVARGVELPGNPRAKDPARLRAFVHAARTAAARTDCPTRPSVFRHARRRHGVSVEHDE